MICSREGGSAGRRRNRRLVHPRAPRPPKQGFYKRRAGWVGGGRLFWNACSTWITSPIVVSQMISVPAGRLVIPSGIAEQNFSAGDSTIWLARRNYDVACFLTRLFHPAQHLRAFAGSFSQLRGQTFDNGVVEACFVCARACVVYFIGKLPGHPFEPFDQRVGAHACLARKRAAQSG